MRMVLVPGFTQRAGIWDGVTARLAGEPEAVDLPDRLTFEETALELGALHGEAEYVGYSLGGRLCLRLALERPSLVSRLVLMSASPGIAAEAERARRRAADEEWAQLVERDGVGTFYERWLAQPIFAGLSNPGRAMGSRERRQHVITHGLRGLGQGAMEPLWDRLHELAMPVTLIVGALDEKYTSIAAAMCERIDDATMHAVAGAGHAVHLEEPAGVARLLAS